LVLEITGLKSVISDRSSVINIQHIKTFMIICF